MEQYGGGGTEWDVMEHYGVVWNRIGWFQGVWNTMGVFWNMMGVVVEWGWGPGVTCVQGVNV